MSWSAAVRDFQSAEIGWSDQESTFYRPIELLNAASAKRCARLPVPAVKL
jgi:hypothetical protein